ncbi:MAG: ABC transporter substrate-binding protein [Anaerolineae bacterium]|nr:ABC transporter substrate-binding protein [Anaerolineae bacterium]
MNKPGRKNWYVFFVCLIVFSMLLAACDKKEKVYTIGVISSSANLNPTIDGFKEGMTGLGYVEGENLIYVYNGAITDTTQLDAAAQKLVAAKVDLILSLATPSTQAAQRATSGTNIPVVFIPLTDPVGAGIVDSLARPGGNLTGVTFSTQEGRRLEWLLQVVPTIKKIYIVYTPDNQGATLALQTVSEAAGKLGVELITREARTPEEIEAGFKNIPEEADAVVFLPDTQVNTRIKEWAALANERKLPTSGPNLAAMNDGILTSYGVDLAVAGKEQAARMADQILKGTLPANLPVEMADFFSGVNLQVANVIGVEVPNEILRQADVIVR